MDIRSLLAQLWADIAVRRGAAGDWAGAQRATSNQKALRYANQVEHHQRGRCPVPAGMCEDCDG